jgi:hypothetical protein
MMHRSIYTPSGDGDRNNFISTPEFLRIGLGMCILNSGRTGAVVPRKIEILNMIKWVGMPSELDSFFEMLKGFVPFHGALC